jgi:hypothetical protein
MFEAPAEWIGEEGQAVVPECLQAWIQLLKAAARSLEQTGRSHKILADMTIEFDSC